MKLFRSAPSALLLVAACTCGAGSGYLQKFLDANIGIVGDDGLSIHSATVDWTSTVLQCQEGAVCAFTLGLPTATLTRVRLASAAV